MSEERTEVITSEFRLAFPQVFEAKGFENSEKKSYSIVMLFPKASGAIDPIRKLAEAALMSKWPDAAKKPKGTYRSPIRDGDEKAEEWGDEFAGHWFIRASSLYKPAVVNRKKEEIIDPDDIYSGCYARAVITAFAYDNKGNKGVSIGLSVVQKLRDGEHLSGGAASVKKLDDLPEDNSSEASPETSSATEGIW